MDTQVLAHRGFSGRFPENTMRAFREAVSAGADGVEFDVQRTRDGELVVIHDERLDYSTEAQGWVHDYSWPELRRVRLRPRSGGPVYEDTIPHLDEVLGYLSDHETRIIVELKNAQVPYDGLGEQVLTALAGHRLTPRTIISSFNHPSILGVKEIDPEVTTGIILAGCLHDFWGYARSVKADALHLHRGFVHAGLVRAAQAEGFLVNTYTVDDELEIRRMLDAGVDGIITNHPDRVNQLMRQP
jgi:glycerophosphoryl diester phosphodiesterase